MLRLQRTWRCNIKIGYSFAVNQKQSPRIYLRRRKFSIPVNSFLDLYVEFIHADVHLNIYEHVTRNMAPIIGSELV
jgi:hypothetical protein